LSAAHSDGFSSHYQMLLSDKIYNLQQPITTYIQRCHCDLLDPYHHSLYIKQLAQLRQRDHASSPILRGWVTSRLNLRLKGHVLRQHLWIIRWKNGYTTTLLLEVFTQRLCNKLYSTETKLYFLKIGFLSHPLGT